MAMSLKRPERSNKLLAMLFQMRDSAHLTHLKTTSYAKHKALDEFYSDLLDLTDTLVESIQGIYGLQEITVESSKAATNIEGEILSFYNSIAEHYNDYSETWIKNELDEISKLCAQTLYKLKYLS